VEEEKKVEVPEPEPPKEPVLGESVIKYNHYKEAFKHIDGAIPWEDIDEEYGFSDVFEGDYNLVLRKETDGD